MDALNWFKLDCIYPLTSDFNGSEELSDVEKIQLRNEGILDDYETGTVILNLAEDTIVHLIPKCFIPKGKTNRKYYTEIVMKSGDVVYGLGKPDFIYDKLNAYLDILEVKRESNL
jgi:hypothetical protein